MHVYVYIHITTSILFQEVINTFSGTGGAAHTDSHAHTHTHTHTRTHICTYTHIYSISGTHTSILFQRLSKKLSALQAQHPLTHIHVQACMYMSPADAHICVLCMYIHASLFRDLQTHFRVLEAQHRLICVWRTPPQAIILTSHLRYSIYYQ